TGSVAPLPSFMTLPPRIVGPHVVVTRLSSPPTHARAGHRYVLRGMVVNEGSAGTRSRVVVHLLRVGSPPLAVGGAAVVLAAPDSPLYRARVQLPRSLRDGSYALVACARRGGQGGGLACATAERHLQIGTTRRAERARASTSASGQAACSSGAHSLSPFG